MRPKFLKFERDQSASKKFFIGINESEKLQNSMKVDEKQKVANKHTSLLRHRINYDRKKF
jgi:hypothetical protein